MPETFSQSQTQDQTDNALPSSSEHLLGDFEHLPATLTAVNPVYIKQVKQLNLMDGLQKLFADIYGDRSFISSSLADVMERVGCDRLVTAVVTKTNGQPLANKLIDRLSHRLALTAEGQKQFQVLKLLYGLNGDQPRSAAEIASLSGQAPKEIKHLSIMMRCRLESDAIRAFVEDTIKLLADEFQQSELFTEIIAAGTLTEGGITRPERLEQRQTLVLLDNTARDIVAKLSSEPTVNISGQVGTGKTTLALKIASQLLAQGKRVLYVCHSRFFAHQIQQQTRLYSGDLTVSTFHALCHLYAKQADIEIPGFRNNKVFNELFPELLIEAMHKRRENAFDAIIVDEGHSLLPNFWRALKFCLKDLHESSFLYFYDPVIMGLAKQKAAPFAVQNINLEKSLRPNFNLVNHHEGLELYESTSKDEANAVVSRIIASLTLNGVQPEEIAILSADSVPKVSANRYNLPRGIKLAATPGDRSKYVLYTSLSSFRALTKRVIILTLGKEVEDLAPWKQRYLSYLAFSRAEQQLILVGSLKSMHTLLPQGVKTINPEDFSQQIRRQ